MVIEESSASVNPGTAMGDLTFAKRKRTLSQVSPPKEGGQGPPKCRKDGWPHTVRSISPIPSSTDIQESGFILSPLAPILPLNPNSGSPIDDASVLLDTWDEEMADENQDADGEQQQTSFSPTHINEGAIPHDTDPPDHSRNTMPSLSAIECLVMTENKMQDKSMTPEKPCVGIPTPRPMEEVAGSHTIPQDNCEIEVVPHDDTTITMM
ncbi:uncharacterized protein F5147DRAFT_652827 [Suillus discolor]|uniref:Uncharacterized protein n=1 Tax=Suillus discolor TaxID=1912936 RepID=A0A9P7F868_9AGAM|nr:uncharacterized protein F5147DRAFT_652827 [Suillus discolor]KAG2108467.1 hypothetical protein F5147DRAFT_652827 [Suillus discolor]